MMFLPDGVPVRARLNCTFIEYVDPEQEAKAANLQTRRLQQGARGHARRDAQRDRRPSCYDDPRLWRPIAIANGIADPRAIARRPVAAHPVAALPRPGDRGGGDLDGRYPHATRPSSRVRLDGAAAADRDCAPAITSLRYQDGLEGADRVELTLANDGLQWLDHPLLQVDTRLRARSSATRPIRSRRSSSARSPASTPTFPSSGMPTLTRDRARLPAAADDRHQGPRVRAEHPVHRQVPAAGPVVAELVGATNLLVPAVDPLGAALSFLDARCVAYAHRPAGGQALDPHPAGPERLRLPAGLAQGERLGDVHRPHRASPGLRAALPVPAPRTTRRASSCAGASR